MGLYFCVSISPAASTSLYAVLFSVLMLEYKKLKRSDSLHVNFQHEIYTNRNLYMPLKLTQIVLRMIIYIYISIFIYVINSIIYYHVFVFVLPKLPVPHAAKRLCLCHMNEPMLFYLSFLCQCLHSIFSLPNIAKAPWRTPKACFLTA